MHRHCCFHNLYLSAKRRNVQSLIITLGIFSVVPYIDP